MNRSMLDGTDISATEKRIENGTVFEFSSKLSVSTGASGKWLFKTGNRRVVVIQRSISTNGDEIEYQAFGGVTVSNNGASVAVVNRNPKNALKETTKVFSSPTVSGGAPIPAVYMPGSSGVGQRTIGQFNQDGAVRILEENTNYELRATNNGSENPANISIYVMWAELDSAPRV